MWQHRLILEKKKTYQAFCQTILPWIYFELSQFLQHLKNKLVLLNIHKAVLFYTVARFVFLQNNFLSLVAIKKKNVFSMNQKNVI